MPLYVMIQLVPVWLQDSGVSLTDIGIFSLLGLPYTLKVFWAPFMDRWVPPFLGRRRGWMLICQVALIIGIGLFGLLDPLVSIWHIAAFAFAVYFFSASQDIVIDAYRRELLPDQELGIGNVIHVQAYRISGLVPGSLSFILADSLPWSSVFLITAAFMLVGVVMTLSVSEPDSEVPTATSLKDIVVAPFAEYLDRKGWMQLFLVIAFMFFYKVGDNMATAMSSLFYVELGFTKTQIGLVAKNAALWPAIIGGVLGGVAMIRLGINRALWVFGFVQLVSILGFLLLADSGPVLWLLAAVIAFEYLGVGLGTAAFIAFIARETSRVFAATQFALFTAMAAVPRQFANATTGKIVDTIGWYDFFLFCALLALPGMLLLWWVAPWNSDASPEKN